MINMNHATFKVKSLEKSLTIELENNEEFRIIL